MQFASISQEDMVADMAVMVVLEVSLETLDRVILTQ